MNTEIDEKPPRLNSYRPAIMLICFTAAVCLVAVIFRVPIRSRYWAGQVIAASSVEERAVPLTCLCNAGDAGRWGISVLVGHELAEMRQYGVLALQYTQSDWARDSLVRLLRDPDESVRELAALGLAMHGDERVIPALRRLSLEGEARAAVAAILALQRLGASEAVDVLVELAYESGDVARRAALVDALTQVGLAGDVERGVGVKCAGALLVLLDDHRPCDVSSLEKQILNDLGPALMQQGIVDAGGLSPSADDTGKLASGEPAHATRVESTPTQGAHTIAERAAGGLERITGLSPPFLSKQSDEEQAAAIRIWKAWIEEMEGP